MLREMIAEMKSLLKNKDAPFGVDLLIPAVGGTARKTNVGGVLMVEMICTTAEVVQASSSTTPCTNK